MGLGDIIELVLAIYGGFSLVNDLAAWMRGREVIEVPKADLDRLPSEPNELLEELRRDGRRR